MNLQLFSRENNGMRSESQGFFFPKKLHVPTSEKQNLFCGKLFVT